MSRAEDRDLIATAKAGADQMHAVYKHVWLPLFQDVAFDFDDAGLRPGLVDEIVADLHRMMIGMTTLDTGTR